MAIRMGKRKTLEKITQNNCRFYGSIAITIYNNLISMEKDSLVSVCIREILMSSVLMYRV